MVTRTLAEAAALGVVGRDALGDPGRALLAGEDAETAMRIALPAPVDYVLLQNDLTIVAPGPAHPRPAAQHLAGRGPGVGGRRGRVPGG